MLHVAYHYERIGHFEEPAERDRSKVHEVRVQRVLSEETRYGVAYVVLHHDHENKQREHEQERDLHEVCGDLITDGRSVALPLGPITECGLTVIVQQAEQERDNDEDVQLEDVSLLEERHDLLLVVCKEESREERRRRVGPPFTVEPEDLLVHPPLVIILPPTVVHPPVIRSCPPCDVSADTCVDTQKNDDYADVDKAFYTAPLRPEVQIENDIKDCKNDRKPCISVHHRDAEEVSDPLQRFYRPLDQEHHDAVQDDIDIERDNERLNDSLIDESLEVILLCIVALQKAVAGAEEEQCDEVRTCIDEEREHSFFLEEILLRYVVKYDA